MCGVLVCVDAFKAVGDAVGMGWCRETMPSRGDTKRQKNTEFCNSCSSGLKMVMTTVNLLELLFATKNEHNIYQVMIIINILELLFQTKNSIRFIR